jgi:hypothetical protein
MISSWGMMRTWADVFPLSVWAAGERGAEQKSTSERRIENRKGRDAPALSDALPEVVPGMACRLAA